MAGFGSSKDRTMKRSVQQAMYRYLPGRWIDFYIKSSRDSYSAYVENWNSEKLEGANTSRIMREVWQRLEALGANTSGFAPLKDESAWTVLTPKTDDANSAVISSVSPLLFFCSNPRCRRAKQFNFSDAFLRNHQKNMKCSICGAPMTQVKLIYYCQCGWAGPVKLPKADCNCNAPLIQKSSFSYACSKCHRQVELFGKCPVCGQAVAPRNALDNAHFYPHSISLIDLVDEEREKYIYENDEGCYLTLAYWLGFITRERFQEAIRFNIHSSVQKDREAAIQEQLENFRKIAPGIPDEVLRSMAENAVDTADPIKDVREATKRARALVPKQGDNMATIRRAALNILELDTILFADEVLNCEDGATIATELNEIDDTKRYADAMKEAKIALVQASGKVPFVSAVYGYSRKGNEIGKGGTKLCAFAQEKATKSNIYATKMETEGILFEIDRREILRWLQKNGRINELEYSESMSEEEVKAWFITNCDDTMISPYGEIDEAVNYRFAWVFKLLHSIAHELIRQASAISGLDKSSISEYIIADAATIFIYCQNSQGFNLGAMFSVMEAQLNHWLKSSMDEIQQCIFDPVCREETGACAGCLFLTDVSCHYMNKNLDRRLLIGYTDDSNGRIYGFWEE